jgi:hypothetical protein
MADSIINKRNQMEETEREIALQNEAKNLKVSKYFWSQQQLLRYPNSQVFNTPDYSLLLQNENALEEQNTEANVARATQLLSSIIPIKDASEIILAFNTNNPELLPTFLLFFNNIQ